MDYIKRAVYGPDAAEQKRKCNALIRQNQRELDRTLQSLTQAETKTKAQIRAAAKRKDVKSARFLAREIVAARRQRERLHKSKAQLNSVQLQVNEAFAIRKLEGSIKASTGVMRQVNALVRMPEIMLSMQQLSKELMTSGIIDEMVADTLDQIDDGQLEDSDAEAEVDAVINEVSGVAVDLPQAPQMEAEKPQKAPVAPVAEPEEEEPDEEMLHSMRERLRALQS